jgi:TRAP-type uncharacterized transport system fused permease subunit
MQHQKKGVEKMNLENGRDVVRGILLLIFAAVAYWGDRTLGLALVALMSALILQSAFSDWCPADLFLRPLGLKRKDESGRLKSR